MRFEVALGAASGALFLGLLVYCSPSTDSNSAPSGDGGTAVCDDSGANCPCDPAKEKLPVDCYTGPRGTSGRGACATGKRSCQAQPDGTGVRTDCVGEVVPTTEVCDYLDNDCNGIVDDVPGSSALSPDAGGAQPMDLCQAPSCDPNESDAGVSCYAGQTRNVCKAGNKVCGAGRQLTCEAWGLLPQPEICNGWDDDCNDQVDDNTTDVGNCQIDPDAGVTFPDGGMVYGECLNSQSTCADAGLVCPPSDPSTEKCDGKDNDCNGVIDDHACTQTQGYNYCCHSGSYYLCGTSAYSTYGYTCVLSN